MSSAPNFVCSNPNCRSFGQRHPNCRCLGPGDPDPNDTYSSYASGGAVHFCSHALEHNPKCEHYAEGGEVRDNQEFQNDPALAVDHAIVSHGLLGALTRTGYSKSPDANRSHEEFLEHSRKGKNALRHHSDSLVAPEDKRMEADAEQGRALESKLAEFSANPNLALQIGGNLGDTLPVHHALLAAKAGTAMNYLGQIKPKPTQAGPLDPLIPPSNHQQKAYERQLSLAENPRLIYQHAQDGNLIPQDFQTLNTLYPKLRTSMQDRAFETLANAKAANKELSHQQKRKVGAMLGQPVTFQQTPMASQAILKANAPSQPPPAQQKKPKKATNVELQQINKVNELSQTPLQRLQTARNS